MLLSLGYLSNSSKSKERKTIDSLAVDFKNYSIAPIKSKDPRVFSSRWNSSAFSPNSENSNVS